MVGKYRGAHGYLDVNYLCNRTLLKGKIILNDTQAFGDPNMKNDGLKNLSFIYENVFIIIKMLIITAKDTFYQ